MGSNKDNRNTTMLFRAMSQENRLRIVQLLSQRTLCVGAISNLLGISPGAVSQHLRVLKDAGLVKAERRGYFIHYAVAPDAAAQCKTAIESTFSSKKGRQAMCYGKTKCKRPKELKGKPEKCSPEQIIECHGGTESHPCLTKKDARKGSVR